MLIVMYVESVCVERDVWCGLRVMCVESGVC